MDTFLRKVRRDGPFCIRGVDGIGIWFKATERPRAVSFRTMPYPGFPTDLQAPMMTAQCLASGKSTIQETVWENRLVHVRELQKMGPGISVHEQIATIVGVDKLYGASVIAPDIRASYALVIAGLAARGEQLCRGHIILNKVIIILFQSLLNSAHGYASSPNERQFHFQRVVSRAIRFRLTDL